MNLPETNSVIAGMSPEILATFFGAIAGGGIAGLIELLKWNFGNRALTKSLKIGLYFEISDNRISELASKDGTPKLSLALFHDSFYRQNKADITRLFDEELVVKLAKFYLMITTANSHQNELFKKAQEQKDAMYDKTDIGRIGKAAEMQALIDQIQAIRKVLEVTLCPAIELKKDLLSDLKSAFKKTDPEKLLFIRVPQKYEKWWDKVSRNQEE